MGAPRQQRRNNARGSVPFKPLAVAEDVQWTWGYIDPHTAALTLTHRTGNLQLNGIPHVTAAPFGGAATAATLAGSTLTVTFANPMNPSGSLTIPQKDPALRTSNGGYLTGGTQSASAPGPADVNTWGDGAHVSGDVAVGNTTAAPATWIIDPPATKQFIVCLNDGQTMGNLLTLNNTDGTLIQTLDQAQQATLKWDGTNWQLL